MMADLSARQARLARPLVGRDFLTVMRLLLGYLREESVGWDLDSRVDSVSLDSRLAGPGAVFVALAGQKVDGHDYIPQVIAAGCRVCLVQDAWAVGAGEVMRQASRDSGVLFLVYADVVAALQDWAGMYLRSLGDLVRIGVTGSSGKTTTKELLVAVISQERRVFASPGNMNSILGLPLALLSVPEGTEVGIFEMAMSEVGEMGALARMVCPTVGVITNIGRAHIGNIGSQEGIAAEKKQLVAGMGAEGRAFLPETDPWTTYLGQGLAAQVLLYGETANPGYEGWSPMAGGQVIRWNGQAIPVRLGGLHHRLDILAAIRVAVCLGISAPAIRAGLEAFTPQAGRGQVLAAGSWTVVNDCYNANPDSMAASMRAFMDLPCQGRRVMILGDMGELGTESQAGHEEIGRLAAELRPAVAFFVGGRMADAARVAARTNPALDCRPMADKAAAARALEGFLRPGDLVLLKASRSMEMEALFPVLGLEAKIAVAGGTGPC